MITGIGSNAGLGLPSAARVLAGIVITLALACGAIVLLKRVLLKADRSWTSHGIRIVGKAALGSSLRAHLLEVDAARVLVVEGRSGVGLTVLPSPSEQPREAAK